MLNVSVVYTQRIAICKVFRFVLQFCNNQYLSYKVELDSSLLVAGLDLEKGEELGSFWSWLHL